MESWLRGCRRVLALEQILRGWFRSQERVSAFLLKMRFRTEGIKADPFGALARVGNFDFGLISSR